MTSAKEEALKAFEEWYGNLRVYGDFPARGTIGSSLVVLERLKGDYDLNLDSHRAAGKSQIRGASGAAVTKLLEEFGEKRRFLSEGGRTNRGAPGDIGKMLRALQSAGLDVLNMEERNEILKSLQGFLVDKVREYHGRQRLKVVYDPNKSTWHSIYDLLALARQTGKEGPVAQYLVGAKLQLRFPNIQVDNKSYSTADDQLDRPGDFCVGDTVFHVTVSPMPGVYEKCRRNLEVGFRVYLLVSDRNLIGAKQNAENMIPGKITVESIESFIGQNIEEVSSFSKEELVTSFRKLLETYNSRVDAVENDKSFLVEIPRNLLS